ncbi:YQGE family putative transporter [Paenibacillus taihuensis]|uniref:YQGE family putative transporter n=1 Tax=Paenibacillus taihuensis TaxID=1156355 RepID=A0A3D9S0Z9_9BACL|nr:MFS transporter [Paenibacillus taihuensis]REE86117.1 YQGE family putative transporter [Paenibacillus taihuensis]
MKASLGIRRPHLFRSSPVPKERQLGREAIIALIIHGCFQFGASMSGLFLNLYLWRLTQDLSVNGFYNMIVFLCTPVAFALGGWVTKRKDRMVTYRIGILTIAVFYLVVVIAQEKVAEWYMLFAIFQGMASGFYWTAYLVLQYDVSTENNRIRFLAINMIVFNGAGLVGPALAGFIIRLNDGLQGYIITFILALVMFVLASVISFRIPTVPLHHRTYHLNLMGIVMRKNAVWVKGLASFFVLGIFQGIMLFLPNILLYQTVGREDWVGYFGVCFSALTVATGYVISRKAKKEQVRKYVLFSTSGTLFGAVFLLYDVATWTVLIFMIMFSVCNPLAINTLTSYYYRLIGTLPLKGQLKVESVVMRELFLNTGRILSITLLLSFSKNLDSIWLPVVLAGTASMQYLLFWLIRE